MRVSRVDIFGFKSFLDRLSLPLQAGVTGVVGPNGCGKSNIVDAIRWVLGETRASNLRGGTLEDVIFNGTDKLRPLGLAEVTLTLRASDKGFFADIQDDLRPFVVEGGGADAISSDPEPDSSAEGSEARRPHLTVISGALDPNASKANPETNIANVDKITDSGKEEVITEQSIQDVQDVSDLQEPPPEVQLFSRFAWLKSLSEVQVTRRLYRSGESEFFINRVACRLRDLKDLFRVIGLGTRAYTIVAQGEVSRIVTSKPEERRLILEEAAGVSGFRDRIATARRRLEETALNISRIDDVMKEVARQVNSLRVQASRARNRQQLRDRIAELETMLFRDSFQGFQSAQKQIEADLVVSKDVEQRLTTQLQRVQAEEQESRGALMSLDVEGDLLRLKIDTIRDELGQRGQKRSSLLLKTRELQTKLEAISTEGDSLVDRKQVNQQRLAQVVSEIDALSQQAETLQRDVESGSSNGEERLRNLNGQLTDSRRELKQKEDELRFTREQLASLRSRHEALEEQIALHSPLQQLQRALLTFGIESHSGDTTETQARLALPAGDNEKSRMVEALAGQVELFADGLYVPGHLTRAVQAIVAERAAYLVTNDAMGVARRYLAELRTRDEQASERSPASVLPIGIFSSHGEKTPRLVVNDTVAFPRLIDLITVEETSRYATEQLFAGVYLVQSVEEAFGFFEQNKSSDCILVTPSGEIITEYSYVNLQQGGGIFQLRQEALNLQETIRAVEQQSQTLSEQRVAIGVRIDSLENEQRQALSDIQADQVRQREISNELGTVRGRLQASERIRAQLQSDFESLSSAERDLGERRSQLQSELEIREVEAKQAATESDGHLEEELKTLQSAYSVLDQNRKQRLEHLSGLSSGTDEVRRQCDEARQEISRLSLEAQKIELEIRSLHERVLIEYGEDFWASRVVVGQAGISDLSPEDKKTHQEEVQRLRTRVAREGEVDSTSIERYEEEKARLENLESQKRDLEEATATLQRTINQLTETSEQRFVSMFRAVKDNFARIIPRLYGGGKGSLELTDPDRPLESGIEIIVRPPGKKLKSIELLSGGEKALCAIGLIVAIFSERPSPLCILDEVDAPLDEANLVRFLSVIKEMSTRTQFVLVTHNKQSMAVADSLVGVTMQQPGASKVVTVSLQEAFAHVA